MREKSKVLRTSSAIIAIAVTVLACTWIAPQVAPLAASTLPSAITPIPAKPDEAVKEQLSGWRYDAIVAEGVLRVSVNFDVSSRQGVMAYADANRQLVGQVSSAIPAILVFKQPLSATEFQDVVQKSGIQVQVELPRLGGQ